MQRSKPIWITGSKGRLGTVIKKQLSNRTEYKVIGTDIDVDITDINEVRQAMDVYRPRVVINCASISDAAYCEEHRTEAYKVNALGARNLASATEEHNVKLIHISTDDVFSGIHNFPKNEFDIPTPKTVYGKSKFAGENFVRDLNPRHLIIRSSWVYGAGKNSYYDFVLEKAKAGEKFKAPMDVISSPTCVYDIAEFIEKVLDISEYGIFHVSSKGACTRLSYAREILKLNGFDEHLVDGTFAEEDGHITSTVLENLMLEITGIHEMPEWLDALKAYAEMRKKEAK